MLLTRHRNWQQSCRIILIFSLLFVLPACATQLQFSTDNGHTWQRFDSPLQSPPPSALVRLKRYPSTHLHLPSCALTGSLRIQVWRLDKTDQTLGLRWYSDICHPHLTLPVGITVENINSVRRKPEWLSYTRRSHQSEPDEQADPAKEKSFFSKYGIYILLFVGIALGQGIRQGLAELREEMEREELERKQNKGTQQVKVVVPKRKHSGKAKKRTAASTTTS